MKVSWAIGDHPYGAVGKVFTLDDHRRKGYSAIVCAELTRLIAEDAAAAVPAEVAEGGELPRCAAPFCFIVADNEASVKLFTGKLGYVQAEGSGQVDWVGF